MGIIMTERTKRRAQFLIDIAYFAVIALIAFLAFKYVAGWILPFIVAFCIVAVIHPVINKIVGLIGIKQEIVSIIVMILIYALAGTLLFLLIMQIVFVIRDAFALLPDYYENTIKPAMTTLNGSLNDFLRNLPEPWLKETENLQADIFSQMQNYLLDASQKGVSAISNLTGRVPAFMLALMFTIMLSFFICVQYDAIVKFLKTQLPPRSGRILKDTRLILVDTVIKYVRAAITLMFITFAELAVSLLFLGQKNAVPIAAGIAIFDALPFFGTGAIMIPWVIIELVQMNFSFAFGLAIVYAIVTVVRNIIEPKVVGDKLGLNPVVSLVSIYLGFKLLGVFGMIIMPIVTQILLELHKKGSIKVFRESISQD